MKNFLEEGLVPTAVAKGEHFVSHCAVMGKSQVTLWGRDPSRSHRMKRLWQVEVAAKSTQI